MRLESIAVFLIKTEPWWIIIFCVEYFCSCLKKIPQTKADVSKLLILSRYLVYKNTKQKLLKGLFNS